MSNLEKIRSLEARDKTLRDRITGALMAVARTPLDFSSHIPLLQVAATVAGFLSMRVAALVVQAIALPEDATLAKMIADADEEFTAVEKSIGPLLDQVTARDA